MHMTLAFCFDKLPSDPDWIRHSSIVGPMDPTKPYPPFDSARAREPSISSSLDAASAIEEPGYSPSENGSSVPPSGPSTPRPSTFPSIGIQNRSRSPFSNNFALASSSPVTFLGSGGQFASNMDYSSSFEAQLRASPVINDILEWLARCEISTQEIHRNFNDVHRKVDILLDRSTGFTSQRNSRILLPRLARHPASVARWAWQGTRFLATSHRINNPRMILLIVFGFRSGLVLSFPLLGNCSTCRHNNVCNP